MFYVKTAACVYGLLTACLSSCCCYVHVLSDVHVLLPPFDSYVSSFYLRKISSECVAVERREASCCFCCCYSPAWLMTRSACLMSSAIESLNRNASKLMWAQLSAAGRMDPLPTWRTKRSYPRAFKACGGKEKKTVTSWTFSLIEKHCFGNEIHI